VRTATTTWTTSDYWLEPKNAQTGANKTPYRQIRTKANGSYSFPTGFPYGVELTSGWGYSTAPPVAVKQAVALMAHRLWKRSDAIFGIAGTPALGVTTVVASVRTDSDIQQLLASIDRRGF
jgi:hypothetical protein